MNRPPPTEILVEGRYRIVTQPAVHSWMLPDETCVDEKEGRPVFVRPEVRTQISNFVAQEIARTAARLAKNIESPWLLPVLLVSPRILFAAPPAELRPREPVSVPEAITCLLQLCDVMAKAHAAGIAWIGVEAEDVRVHREEGAYRVTVILPHLPPQGRTSLATWSFGPFDSVRHDLFMAAFFFRDLVTGHVPEPFRFAPDDRPPLPPGIPPELLRALQALLSEEPKIEAIPDVASLAEIASRAASPPADWPARVASLPRVSSVKPVIDWDLRIELGGYELHTVRRPEDRWYTLYPLAAAYHQRALVHHGRGNTASAGRDLDKALAIDRWSRYLVTRGLWRTARGDLDAAYSDYDEAVRLADPTCPPERTRHVDWIPPAQYDIARAHLARGTARHHRGDLASALEDFTLAVSAIETEETTHREYKIAPPPSFAALASACRRALATASRRTG